MNSLNPGKNVPVIGYVRTPNREQLFVSNQDSKLQGFAQRQNLDIVQIEHESSTGNMVTRTGLWRTLRMIVCRNCEPKSMPMTDDYPYWIQEAFKPCACGRPSPCEGLVAESMEIISPNPAAGTKLLLDLCVAKKHLYCVTEKRCMSCCNPQAIEFVRRQLL